MVEYFKANLKGHYLQLYWTQPGMNFQRHPHMGKETVINQFVAQPGFHIPLTEGFIIDSFGRKHIFVFYQINSGK